MTLWTPFPGQPAAADDPPAGHASQDGSGGAGGSDDGPLAGSAGYSLTDGLTDEALQRALTDEALLRRLVDDVVASVPGGPSAPPGLSQEQDRTQRRLRVMALIPAGHGVAAMATVLLAVLAAAR